ncbi:uncharacterized protein LOC143906598 [Temnothorax americanus]|uniref:uncharacterized protein LOC143906598 n=1 Tax=Temnothorax americanus TaxID=1964332 RepID=UPI00406980B9
MKRGGSVYRHIKNYDLSKDDLLERCLGGYTQNSNKSFNASLWHLAPKHLHCGANTIEISAYFATAIFNEGYYPILKIMETMGIVIGQQTKRFVDSQNDKRLRKAEIHILGRTRKKLKQPTKCRKLPITGVIRERGRHIVWARNSGLNIISL